MKRVNCGQHSCRRCSGLFLSCR